MTDRIRKILAGALLLLGVVSTILAYGEHKPFKEAKVKQQAVIQTVVAETEESVEDPLERRIDFETLLKINPDIIGWLYAPQIGVDNPILKGENDTEYLSRGFDGSYSPLGSVFTWAHTDEKLSDQHLCLFGHNMMSGQIFGRLDRFENTGFQKANRKMYLYTSERSKELEVESVFTCRKDDGVFQDDWGKGSGYQTVTLATCTGYNSTPYRLTVNCRVVREKLVLY